MSFLFGKDWKGDVGCEGVKRKSRGGDWPRRREELRVGRVIFSLKKDRRARITTKAQRHKESQRFYCFRFLVDLSESYFLSDKICSLRPHCVRR